MMINKFIYIIYFVFSLFFPAQVFARCAICYTNGMSGASIAVIIIISSFIFLFIANKFLQKFLNKD
tara:strand:+ start:106 stop:303 length:198 start_codon:yes stop_codon:yes gene_type:complete